jgi:thiamine-phosphate pyrophosphorylase
MDITEQMILRLVDANINRLREGLRVSEDICRFVLNDAALSQQFKALRHQIKQAGDMIAPYSRLLDARDAQSDVGATIPNKDENQREDMQRILAANMKRTQECCRVLEEFAKLYSGEAVSIFKTMRYNLYTLEKNIYDIMEERKL